MNAQWKNNLKGGYRVENIRPTSDPTRPWQGEVTVGDDDVQTWTWTAAGQYYGWMPSEYDLARDDEQVCRDCRDADEARARDSYWREVDMDEIGDLMFRIVQTRQPIEVRLRDFSDNPWSQEQLVGFRLDHDGEHRVVYFIDTTGREWLYCQVNRG